MTHCSQVRDQYAARARDRVRSAVQTYAFADSELLAAIDRLASDDGLHTRLRAVSARVQAAPGTVRAADLVERLAHG